MGQVFKPSALRVGDLTSLAVKLRRHGDGFHEEKFPLKARDHRVQTADGLGEIELSLESSGIDVLEHIGFDIGQVLGMKRGQAQKPQAFGVGGNFKTLNNGLDLEGVVSF